MKLYDNIRDSIFDNLDEDKSTLQNKKAIEFLVRQVIRNKNKIEAEVVPSFQYYLNNSLK